jgi:hypothetical protein
MDLVVDRGRRLALVEPLALVALERGGRHVDRRPVPEEREAGVGQLQLVAPPDPPGRVDPERVDALLEAEVPLEVDVVAVEREHVVCVESEIAGVDPEPFGEAVPGARRLRQRRRNQHPDGEHAAAESVHGSHLDTLQLRPDQSDGPPRCGRTRFRALLDARRTRLGLVRDHPGEVRGPHHLWASFLGPHARVCFGVGRTAREGGPASALISVSTNTLAVAGKRKLQPFGEGPASAGTRRLALLWSSTTARAAESRLDGSEGVRDDHGPHPLSRMRPVDHARQGTTRASAPSWPPARGPRTTPSRP